MVLSREKLWDFTVPFIIERLEKPAFPFAAFFISLVSTYWHSFLIIYKVLISSNL